MKLGFRAHDFGKFNTASELARCASSYLESPCLHFAPSKVFRDAALPLTEKWCENITEDLSLCNVKIAVLGVYINPMHPDAEIRESQLSAFENGLEVAHCMGNPVVATETGSLDARNIRCEENFTEKNFSIFLKNIERLLKKAEKNNAVMCLEAVADKNTVDTPEKMLRVMETFNSPYLGVLFDAVNILPVSSVTDFHDYYNSALDMLAKYIKVMHIKDFVMVPSSKEYPFTSGEVKNGAIPAGEGLMDWKTLFKLYHRYGLDNVPMTLENFNPATLSESIKYVREAFENAQKP